ncbi:MAG: UDP-2,3-diacylglucosamine diphosphatase [Rikenellaceae bacterium]
MKIFFASDIHIGVLEDRFQAEKLENSFIDWLDMVSQNGEALYLLGDTFDFWFEYKYTIPKGYSRILAKLQELTHKGIEVHFFHGNHDSWTRDYLSKEIGMTIHYHEPEILELQGKKLMVGHGHMLGLDRRITARIMHALFASKISYYLCEKLFHPDGFIAWGNNWSRNNMNNKRGKEPHTFNPTNNALLRYIDNVKEDIDYFIFGHFHTPIKHPLERKHKGSLIILGEWISDPYYAVMEDGEITLVKR